MIKVQVDGRVQKFLENLSDDNGSRVSRTVHFFQEKGFLLDTKYLKKINTQIWELRAGKVRLLFGMIEGEAMIVN